MNWTWKAIQSNIFYLKCVLGSGLIRCRKKQLDPLWKVNKIETKNLQHLKQFKKRSTIVFAKLDKNKHSCS